MATFIVTTLVDENTTVDVPCGMRLSVRRAIALADASAGAYRIDFDASLAGAMRLGENQAVRPMCWENAR